MSIGYKAIAFCMMLVCFVALWAYYDGNAKNFYRALIGLAIIVLLMLAKILSNHFKAGKK